MVYDPHKHHRRSTRLKGYDYSGAGAYYLTLCTWNRECLFGELKDDKMRLNQFGEIVQEEWLQSAVIRRELVLDVFQIMPNHIHGIVMIADANVSGSEYRETIGASSLAPPLPPMLPPMLPVGATGRSPLPESPISPISPMETTTKTMPKGPKPKSIGAFMAGFRSAFTKRINMIRQTPGSPVWQRNYYDHIVRNYADLERIRQYIMANPQNWEKDLLNPTMDVGDIQPQKLGEY